MCNRRSEIAYYSLATIKLHMFSLFALCFVHRWKWLPMPNAYAPRALNRYTEIWKRARPLRCPKKITDDLSLLIICFAFTRKTVDLTLKNWNCAELRKHKRNSAKLCVCVLHLAFQLAHSDHPKLKNSAFKNHFCADYVPLLGLFFGK